MAATIMGRLVRFGTSLAVLLLIPALVTSVLILLLMLLQYVVDTSEPNSQYVDAFEEALKPDLLPEDPLFKDLKERLQGPTHFLVNSIFKEGDEAQPIPLLLVDNEKLDIGGNWPQLLRIRKSKTATVWGGEPRQWPSLKGEFYEGFQETLLFPTVTKLSSVASRPNCSVALPSTQTVALSLDEQCDFQGRKQIRGFIKGLMDLIEPKAADLHCHAADFECHYAAFQAAFGSDEASSSLIRDALIVRRVYMYVPQQGSLGMMVKFPGSAPFCPPGETCDQGYQEFNPPTRPWYQAVQDFKGKDCPQDNATGVPHCLFEVSFPYPGSSPRSVPCVIGTPYTDVAPLPDPEAPTATVRTISCFLGTSPQDESGIYLMLDLQPLRIKTESVGEWWSCVSGGSSRLCSDKRFHELPTDWLQGTQPAQRADTQWRLIRQAQFCVTRLESTYYAHHERLRAISIDLLGITVLAYLASQLYVGKSATLFVRTLMPASFPTDDRPFKGAELKVIRNLIDKRSFGARLRRAWEVVTVELSLDYSVERHQTSEDKLQEQAQGLWKRLKKGDLTGLFGIDWRLYESIVITWRSSGLSIFIPYGMLGASEIVGIERKASPTLRQFEAFGSRRRNAIETLRDKHGALYGDLISSIALEAPSHIFTQVRQEEGPRVAGDSDRLQLLRRLGLLERAETNLQEINSGKFYSADLLSIIRTARDKFRGGYQASSVIDGQALMRIMTSTAVDEPRYWTSLESWLKTGPETKRIVIIDNARTASKIKEVLSELQNRSHVPLHGGDYRWLTEKGLDGEIGTAFKDFALIADGASPQFCLVTNRVYLRHDVEDDASTPQSIINFEGYVSVTGHDIEYANCIFQWMWLRASMTAENAVQSLDGPTRPDERG